MNALPELKTNPPKIRKASLQKLLKVVSAPKGLRTIRMGYWEGAAGFLTAAFAGALVVTLLVGWVLLWVSREEGPDITLLILGSIGFTIILGIIALLWSSYKSQARIRAAEARFLTGTSHSLRTPLAGIRAACQTLQKPNISTTEEDMLLNAILQETNRLNLRIDNLLETTRLSLEDTVVWTEHLKVADLFEQLNQSLSTTVHTHGGKLRCVAPVVLTIQGDPRALRLMIENLIDNAIKYRTRELDILVHGELSHGFVLIRVIDNGEGFEPGTEQRLFRKFERGDTGQPGIGLGLPLARSIARAHGGELNLWSPGPGQGTVAEIWLPSVAVKTNHMDAPSPVEQETHHG